MAGKTVAKPLMVGKYAYPYSYVLSDDKEREPATCLSFKLNSTVLEKLKSSKRKKLSIQFEHDGNGTLFFGSEEDSEQLSNVSGSGGRSRTDLGFTTPLKMVIHTRGNIIGKMQATGKQDVTKMVKKAQLTKDQIARQTNFNSLKVMPESEAEGLKKIGGTIHTIRDDQQLERYANMYRILHAEYMSKGLVVGKIKGKFDRLGPNWEAATGADKLNYEQKIKDLYNENATIYNDTYKELSSLGIHLQKLKAKIVEFTNLRRKK
eukprot:m.16164 g.16164  ORF g.16164 m.16164 type:complete len:263 (-) comp10908_c0_seq1:153-941(-)